MAGIQDKRESRREQEAQMRDLPLSSNPGHPPATCRHVAGSNNARWEIFAELRMDTGLQGMVIE